MKNTIVVCGDSFSKGIGCRDLTNEPYGSLLSKELNKPLVNLAKGSSTNMSIYLQVKYAVDQLAETTEFVLVSNTSYNRIEWFPIDYEFTNHEITNNDVNYHQYPPYHESSYLNDQIQDHPLVNDPNYSGGMFTENYMGVIDYWETFRSKNKDSGYYARFRDEPKERIKTIYDFARMIHDDRIDRIKSIGVLTMAHQLLKNAGIKHLILTHEVEEYIKFMDSKNVVNVNWGKLSVDYPDDLPSLHTSKEGHIVAFNSVYNKMKENDWV